MQELLLVNPRKRGAHRKTRSPAQKAATRRMVAANRARRTGGVKRRVKRHHSAVAAYAPNPVRRSRARHAISRVKHHVRRYKRNPAGISGGISGMLMQSLQGAAGAIAVNTLLNYIPLPAMMKSGNVKYIAQGVAGILLGVAGRKVMPARLAANMAVGSLTVTLHDAIKDLAGSMIPGVNLGGVGYYTGGYPTHAIPARLSSPVPSRGHAMAGVGMYQHDAVGISF